MDNMSDNYCKATSVGNKLQLKKNSTESLDKDYKNSGNIYQSFEKGNSVKDSEKSVSTCSNFSDSNKDDSLSDFKSPPRKTATLIKQSNAKSTNTKGKKTLKPTRKLVAQKNKRERSNALKQSNENLNTVQLSIESSFFKSKSSSELDKQNTNTAHVCPLCFKTMIDKNTHVAHMKSCAIKNNVSTKKLLDAVELQERQAEERKSLGLLAAPVLQSKKKVITRRPSLHEDSELGLAIALSKSLHEAEQLNELDEISVLNEVPKEVVMSINEAKFKEPTLLKLGFMTNQPVLQNTNNNTRKRKLCGFTILQTRSQEERNQILTERIAEVLIGNEAITQNQQPAECTVQLEKIALKSHMLQKYYRTEDRLWDKTNLMADYKDFYSVGLSEHIGPTEKQLLKLNNELNNLNEQKIINPEEVEDKTESNTYQKREGDMNNKVQTLKATEEHEQEDIEKRFVNDLIMDWGNALNNSSASDVIVFVNDDRHIWTHKLVFYVRCSNVLLDIQPNDNSRFSSVKEKICWKDIDYDIALAFLEFIYCGVIKSWKNVINNPEMLSGIRCLARRYKVKDLFEYLRKMETKCKIVNVENDVKRIETDKIVHKKASILSNTVDDCNESVSSRNGLKNQNNLKVPLITVNKSPDVQNSSDDAEVNIKDPPSQEMTVCERSASPDIFDDMEEEIVTNNSLQQNSQIPEPAENSGLNILLSLVNKDFQSDSVLSETSKPGTETSPSSIKENQEQSTDNNAFAIQTPSSTKADNNRTSNMTKQKNDISLFIEKIQQHNAKSDSDFDSEIDTPVNIRSKFRRNPFNVNGEDESVSSPQVEDEIAKIGGLLKKPSALSMLENDTHGIGRNVSQDFQQNNATFVDENEDLKFDEMDWSNEQVSTEKLTKDLLVENDVTKEKNRSFISNSNNESERNNTIREEETESAKSDTTEPPKQGISFKSFSQSALQKNTPSICEGVTISASFCMENFTHNNTSFGIECKSMKGDECNSTNCKEFLKSQEKIEDTRSEFMLIGNEENKNNLDSPHCVEEDVDNIIISDEDEDEDEDMDMEDVSMYTKYKKKHLYNSIVDYRLALMEHLGEEENQNNSSNNSGIENVGADEEHSKISPEKEVESDNMSTTSTLILETDAINRLIEEVKNDGHSSSPQQCSTQPDKNNKKRIVLEDSEMYDVETDVEEEANENIFRNIRSLSQGVKDFQDNLQSTEKNVSVSPETSIFSSNRDPKTVCEREDVLENSQEEVNDVAELCMAIACDNTKSVEKERITTPSPLLISSSPEDLDVEFVGTQCSLDSNNMETDSLNSNENNEDDELNSIFYHDLNLANFCSDYNKVNESLHLRKEGLRTSPSCNLVDHPNITLNMRGARKKCISKDDNNQVVNTNSINNEENDNSGVSSIPNETIRQSLKRIRQLKVKSVSENNIHPNKSRVGGKGISRFSSTQTYYQEFPDRSTDIARRERSRSSESKSCHERTPDAKNRNANQQSTSDVYKELFGDEKVIITDKDVTPSPDYDKKGTPELHREMRKYGLKLQKRSRAVKLLTYIYNETHPLVPVNSKEAALMVSDSEEEGPPLKRLSQRILPNEQDCDLLSQNSNTSVESTESVNPAEMEYDEPESTPILDNPKNIKEVFSALVSNDRDLHNKILMYEPLNLVQLKAALKATGFKCELKTLINFLDEQCIVFCVPENTLKSSTKRRQPEKASRHKT